MNRMRIRTAYGLIGLTVLMLVILVVLIMIVGKIRFDVKESAQSTNLACKRANVQRDATRFLLLARVHDAELIASSSTNKEIAEYFAGQEMEARKKLAALLASASLTYPNPNDPFLIDCDRSFPLP